MGRSLLLLSVAAWLTLAAGVARASRTDTPPPSTDAGADTLQAPPVLRNMSRSPHTVEVSLTAAPARLVLSGGKPSDVFAYNGRTPGPTLDIREGDSVIVHFRNELPEPTTVHWHGLHIPASEDGSPFDPVMPGSRHDYVFRVPPGSAGTYWYHPHPDHRAGYQVGMGLFGAVIVRAANDSIPTAVQEKLLVLSDNSFRPDGSIDFPDHATFAGHVDAENGREGSVLLVNGQVMPSLTIRPGEVQRWRIINASAARVYRLSLTGSTLLWVASSGGLFEHPVETQEIVLANSDRVDLLVRGDGGSPGTVAKLQALPYDRYDPHTRPPDWDRARDLLTLRYSEAASERQVAIPTVLRRVDWLDTTNVAEHRVLVLTQGMINGKLMDMNRVDFKGHLGTTEIWEIENLVAMDHPFHLHGFRFQLLDRNGTPELVPRWYDTINVPKHESARIVVRFEDFPGKWMYHCHILDHEDMGMMGVLQLE